jgi:hypothetical protein
MSRTPADRFSLKHALGLSTVLHVLLAPFFVVGAVLMIGAGHAMQAVNLPSDEQASVATITIEHRRQSTVTRHMAPAKTAVAGRIRQPAPLARSADTASASRAQAFVRAATREARTIARASGVALGAVRDFVGSRPAVAATLEPQVQTAIAAPAALPSATPAPVVLTAAVQPAGREGPNGGWGQNFERPLLADETVLSDLRAKYHTSSPISIDVDENGKAVKVVLPDSLTSEARGEIERRLSALRYVPAECNGLRCRGTMQIVI